MFNKVTLLLKVLVITKKRVFIYITLYLIIYMKALLYLSELENGNSHDTVVFYQMSVDYLTF